MAHTKSLSVISHNTTGWSEYKASILNTILLSHSISVFGIQEHMQLKPNLYKIESKFHNYETFSLPAYKSTEFISKGRPSGGLSLGYSKNILNFVEHLVVPNSRRVQGLKVKLPEATYVFINTYFPTDPRTDNFDDNDLITTLQDIRFILNTCSISDNLVLLGDLNTDLGRNSRFVNIVKSFIEENNLIPIWTKFSCDFTYSQNQIRNGRSRTTFSTIDHFIVNENLLNSCVEGCPLHIAENMSNHEIIFLKITIQNLEIPSVERIDDPQPKPAWHKAKQENLNNFKNEFQTSLSDISVPHESFCCRDLHCKRKEHIISLDTYTLAVLAALEEATRSKIPTTSTAKMKDLVKPGWLEQVKPIRDDMLFWHSVWMSAGKPQNTELHKIYQHLRHQYHYAIRKLKNQENEIRKQKLLNQCVEGKVNDILAELKHQRNHKPDAVNKIDGTEGATKISEHFKSLYEEIYNHHGENGELNQTIHEKIKNSDLIWVEKITPDLVEKAISKLSSDKNDELLTCKSNAIKHCAGIISRPICDLFKSFIVHGHFTNILLFCALIPIVKDNSKSKLHSSNYRLIAISSLILKLFDLVFLELFRSKLCVSSLQFGFQKGSSTTLASWTLTEAINYYANRGSPVYLCLLDLTKAFDHVKLDLLFNKLSEKIPASFIRFFIYTYINQQCYIKWNNINSTAFTTSNGVRQGAVASPTFFNIYLDDLFIILQNSNLGCSIDSFYYGILGYADDCSLICPTREGLQSMIDIVKSYCDEHGITISTNTDLAKSKTKCIIFNSEIPAVNVVLYGVPLPWVESWKHLGHTIHQDESSSHDTLIKRAEFIGKVHGLRQELGAVDPKVFLILTQIYLSSFYGSNLWDLDSASAGKLYSSWNRMIQTTYNLPFGTHRFILKELSDRPPLQEILKKRFSKFCEQLKNCGRQEVLHLFNKQLHDSRSTFGRNYKSVFVDKRELEQYITPGNQKWKISFIRELIEITQNKVTIKDISAEELKCILTDLCCK